MNYEDCCICLIKHQYNSITTCGHAFCSNCVHKLVLYNQNEVFYDISKTQTTTLRCICEGGTIKVKKLNLLTLVSLNLPESAKKVELCDTHIQEFNRFYCKQCQRKFCIICLNEHLACHPHHIITNNITDINKYCQKHTDYDEKLRYICTTCNLNICQICYDVEHDKHSVILRKEFEGQDAIRLKKDLFVDEEEIENYIKRQFMFIRDRLAEAKSLIKRTCEEIRNSLQKLEDFYNTKFASIEGDLDVTQELIRICYLKYSKDYHDEFNTKMDIQLQKNFYFAEQVPFHDDVLEQLNKIKDILNSFRNINHDYNVGIHYKKNLFETKFVIKEHEKPIWCIAKLLDGRIATGSEDTTIKIWDVKDSENYSLDKTLTNHEHSVLTLVVLKNNKLVSGGRDLKIIIWDCKNDFNVLKVIEGHKNTIWCSLALKNGKLVTGSYDKTIRVWNTENEFIDCVQVLDEHESYVTCLAQTKYGRFASGSQDKNIKVWDPNNSYTCIKTLEGHTATVLTLCQLIDGRLASGSEDKTLILWDPDYNFEMIKKIEIGNGSVTSVIQLKDGRVLTGSYKSIKIWDSTEQFVCLKRYEAHSNYVLGICYLGKYGFGSVSSDSTVKIWE
jgi:WD40 repeat protein